MIYTLSMIRKGQMGPLQYQELLNQKVKSFAGDLQPVKIALLSQGSTEYFSHFLQILLGEENIPHTLWVAPFNTIEAQVLNPKSELYEFGPDFVLFQPLNQALSYELNPEEVSQHWINLWHTLRKRIPARIIQSNFITNLPRTFGHYESFHTNAYAQINEKLIHAAKKMKDIYFVDVNYLSSFYGVSKWLDERLWYAYKIPASLECLPYLAKGYADILKAKIKGGIKCIVLDLDNTLWGGIIGETDVQKLELGGTPRGEAFLSFQSYLKKLKSRGIILAVASKNNPDDAHLPFKERKDMLLIENDFSVFEASWDEKSKILQKIQEKLQIGLDSMVFLDDSPFERNLIRGLLPEVIVPELPEDPANFISYLDQLNLFETTSFTEEDRNRPEYYQTEAKRKETIPEFKTLNEYLKSLQLKATLHPADEKDLERVIQLSERTNQFNLTGERLTLEQCQAILKNDNARLWSFELADRFGHYGQIGIVITQTHKDHFHIPFFAMSCRALGRGVETWVLKTLSEKLSHHSKVTAATLETKKNAKFISFYKDLGFQPASQEGNKTIWEGKIEEIKGHLNTTVESHEG